MVEMSKSETLKLIRSSNIIFIMASGKGDGTSNGYVRVGKNATKEWLTTFGDEATFKVEFTANSNMLYIG